MVDQEEQIIAILKKQTITKTINRLRAARFEYRFTDLIQRLENEKNSIDKGPDKVNRYYFEKDCKSGLYDSYIQLVKQHGMSDLQIELDKLEKQKTEVEKIENLLQALEETGKEMQTLSEDSAKKLNALHGLTEDIDETETAVVNKFKVDQQQIEAQEKLRSAQEAKKNKIIKDISTLKERKRKGLDALEEFENEKLKEAKIVPQNQMKENNPNPDIAWDKVSQFDKNRWLEAVQGADEGIKKMIFESIRQKSASDSLDQMKKIKKAILELSVDNMKKVLTTFEGIKEEQKSKQPKSDREIVEEKLVDDFIEYIKGKINRRENAEKVIEERVIAYDKDIRNYIAGMKHKLKFVRKKAKSNLEHLLKHCVNTNESKDRLSSDNLDKIESCLKDRVRKKKWRAPWGTTKRMIKLVVKLRKKELQTASDAETSTKSKTSDTKKTKLRNGITTFFKRMRRMSP